MYDHKKIEEKWQKKWDEERLYETKDDKKKKKYYILDMFPYPSGAGLHVGHPKGYIATDVFARMKMMQGYNVLHPMGWDAFGLPAENYAIENKVHPRVATEKNVKVFKNQLLKLGFTYDWGREINTTDPAYYKWTQWIFLQMFKKGLAYESYEPINWCPSCQTGLANEDLEDGKCERCGSEIERKPMRQWVLKITDYAERLLNDLEKLPDWEESIKEMQKNWIGRSEGAEIDFQIKNSDEAIPVFTTRIDTIFSGTFLILAPEHRLVQKITTNEQKKEVNGYIKKVASMSDLERTELNKNKTGVFTGTYVINPATGDEMPVWISDFVLVGYGTGAVFADAHDERDFEMAKIYNLPLKVSIRPKDKDSKLWERVKSLGECFSGEGILVNSGEFDGLTSAEARPKIIEWLEKQGKAKKTVNYKLRDWVFSRQRYWGEPIPIIHCDKCGAVAVPEKDLPVKLPDVKNYAPTGTGESPLANIKDWVSTKCPKCGGPGKRETNTMPQWAGSSWYWLRYIDPKNDKALVDKKKEKYWSPVDFYVGGAEHATRHLIYARFWHKFLFDLGAVNYSEPFTRLQHVGLILAEDGRKMSKRWHNVINPDDIVEKYGADSMRVYEMFMGPFSQPCAWSTNGLIGARKFLEKAIKIKAKIGKAENDRELSNLLHKTIKKVGDDIEEFKLNTAVSAMMILANKMEEAEKVDIIHYSLFIILLAPFAPHLAEELWHELGNHRQGGTGKESIFKAKWPEYDKKLVKDETINLVIQVNGKLRDTILAAADISEKEAKEEAMKSEKVKKWLERKEIVKTIFVKGKLINIVIK
ncbi:MAG: leucine--tRNA ligase [Patescibacteria group bacterium]|nr:leucine--tRNA ligase [Patescibacteria group bacterium]